MTVPCNACNGTGWIDGNQCRICKATGLERRGVKGAYVRASHKPAQTFGEIDAAHHLAEDVMAAVHGAIRDAGDAIWWSLRTQGRPDMPKPRAALLDRAEACGAVVTGKPDASEAIAIVFSIAAWRRFDASTPGG